MRYVACFAVLFAFLVNAENLRYGEEKDLDLFSRLDKKSAVYESGTQSKDIAITVDPASIEIHGDVNGYHTLQSSELVQKGKPGDPVCYMKSARIVLKKNVKVTGVEIIDGKYRELQNPISMRPVPQLYTYSDFGTGQSGALERSARYSANEWYPQKTVSFISGKDNDNTIVYVRLYPVKYNPVTHATHMITNATIRVRYRDMDAGETLSRRTNKKVTDAQNVILTTDSLVGSAAALKDVHETLNNLKCEIVTTEYISTAYTEAENPSMSGYANVNMTSAVRYNHALAKKIIAYLRDNTSHPEMKFLTILGDADLIPPSYYTFFVGSHETSVDSCVATDLFYASPDYDLMPNFAIGRLPVSNNEEVAQISEKIRLWQTTVSGKQLNVQLIGGSFFRMNSDYLCENALLYGVNRGYYSGMNIRKNFYSNLRENAQTIAPLFSDGQTGIIVHYGHGNGKVISCTDSTAFSPSTITASQVMFSPLVFSISCYNAGYDNNLLNDTSRYGSQCFAEALLRSKAGCIGYWGGNRANSYGSDNYYNTEGKLVLKDGLRLLGTIFSNCFKNYSDGILETGAFTKKAVEAYIAEIDSSDPESFEALYSFTYLGDPALRLPPLSKRMVYPEPDVSVWPLPHYTNSTYITKPDFPGTITIVPFTKAPSLHQRAVAYSNRPELFKDLPNGTSGTPFTIAITPNSDPKDLGKQYHYQCEDLDGVETRIKKIAYLCQSNDIPPTPSFLHNIQKVSETEYRFSWVPSMDFDGDIQSYELREISNIRMGVDSCVKLDYWKHDNVSIVNEGYNSNSSFKISKGSVIATLLPLKKGGTATISYSVKAVAAGRVPLHVFSTSKATGGFGPSDDISLLEDFRPRGWENRTINLVGVTDSVFHLGFRLSTFEPFPEGGYCLLDNISVVMYDEKGIASILDTMYTVTTNLSRGSYYQVRAVSTNGNGGFWSNLVALSDQSSVISSRSSVKGFKCQSHFSAQSSSIIIEYDLSESSGIIGALYDLAGRTIAGYESAVMPAGRGIIRWDVKNQKVGSGMYILQVKSTGLQLKQKIQIMP